MRNFQISVVSAVKICTKRLQTASASGRISPPGLLPGLCPWTTLGELYFADPLGATDQQRHSGRVDDGLTAFAEDSRTWNCSSEACCSRLLVCL